MRQKRNLKRRGKHSKFFISTWRNYKKIEATYRKMRSHNDSDNIYTWSGPIQKLSGIILATYPGTSVPIWLLSICDKYSTSYQLHRHWRRMIFKIIHDSLLCSECIWEHIGGNEPVLAENIDHNHLLFLHTIFSGSNFFQVVEVLRPVWYLIFLFLTILTKLSMKTTKQVKPKRNLSPPNIHLSKLFHEKTHF